jgi:branched-chain amino acid transport system substrate-binding protein
MVAGEKSSAICKVIPSIHMERVNGLDVLINLWRSHLVFDRMATIIKKESNMKRTQLFSFGFALVLLMGSSLVMAQDVIRLGAAVSLTGTHSRFGNMVKNGYELWKDLVNERGGINVGTKKYKVEMIYYDDESNPQIGAKLTEKLITEDKVQFLLGPYSSGITLATSTIAEKYKMINIAVVASTEAIYARGYKYIFGVLPPSPMLLDGFLEMLNTLRPTPKRLAWISPTDLFPLNMANGGQAHAKAIGLELVAYEKYPKGAKDISTLLLKIKAVKPDVLVGTGYLDDAILAVRQAKDLKVDFKAMGFTAGPELEDFTKNLGKDADYVYGTTMWTPELNYKCPIFGSPRNYADLFFKKFGPGLVYQAVAASQGAILLQLAIEKAGSLETEKVREALRAYEGTTCWGPTKFDAGGQNVMGNTIAFQIQKGVMVTVFPKDAAQGAPIFPQPPWSVR